MAGVELATAYLSLVPSLKGLDAAITSGFASAGPSMVKAGTTSGQQFARSFGSAVSTAVTPALAAAAAAAARAAAATTAAQRQVMAGMSEMSSKVIDVGKSSIEAAVDYQRQVTLLQTAAGETHKNLALVSDGMLKVSGDTGIAASKIAEGMFIVEKSGNRGADGLLVLKAAAQGATAEGADMTTMTTALTSILASYHLKATDAATVTSQLDRAAGLSKTTMQNFAGSLSKVLPLASQTGISFAEVGGAMATLTSHGTSAKQASDDLYTVIKNMQAPNMVAIKQMSQLGINVSDLSTHMGTRGLQGTLQVVIDSLGKVGPGGTILQNSFKESSAAASAMHEMLVKMPPDLQKNAQALADGSMSVKDYTTWLKGLDLPSRAQAGQFKTLALASSGFSNNLRSGNPATQTAIDALKKMMGGSQGLNAALMLTGENQTGFTERTKEIAGQVQTATGDIATFAETQGTAANQLNKAKQQMANLGITLGTQLLPVVVKFAGWMTDLIGWLKENWNWVGKVAVVVLGLAAAFKGAMIINSFITSVKALNLAFLGSGGYIAGAGRALATFSTFMLTTPWGLAATGIIAIGAALFALPKLFDSASGAQQNAANATDNHRAAVDLLSGALRTSNGLLDSNTRQTALDALKNAKWGDSSTDLTTYVGNLNDASISLRTLVDDMLGVPGTSAKVEAAYQRQSAALQKVIDAGTKSVGTGFTRSDAANAALDTLRILNEQHGAMVGLAGVSKDAQVAAVAAADATKVWSTQSATALSKVTTQVSASVGAILGFGKAGAALTPVQKALVGVGTAATDTKPPIDSLLTSLHLAIFDARQADMKTMTDGLAKVSSTASDATTRLAFFSAQVDLLTHRNRSAEEAEKLLNDTTRSMAQAFTDATTATKGHNESLLKADGSINTVTDAGSKLYDSINSYAKAYDQSTIAAVNNAGSHATVAQKVDLARTAADAARKKFIEMTAVMLGNGTATDETRAKATKLADQMDILEGKKLTPKVLGLSAEDKATPAIAAIVAAINAIKDKTVTLTVKTGVGGMTDAQSMAISKQALKDSFGLASGGTIVGPGTGTSDSVPIWASKGEEVINAQQAEKHRGLLKAINAGMDGFATGGTIPGLQVNMSATGTANTSSTIGHLLKTIAGPFGAAIASAIGKYHPPVSSAVAGVAAALGSVGAAFANIFGGGSGVERWRGLALQVAAAKGENPASVQVMLNQMSRESSGNPSAINLTDSNAQAGHPSVGLLQFIPSTFASFADPGFNTNIYDPQSQMRAWYNYINAQYGGYVSFGQRGYGAYAKGGTIGSDQLALVHSGEEVISAAPAAKYRPLLKAINAQGFASGGTVNPFGLAGIQAPQRGARLSQVYSELDALHQAAAQAASGSHKVAVAYMRVWQATGPLQRLQGSLANTYDLMAARLAAAQGRLDTDRASKASLVSSVAGTISGFDSGILGHTAQRGTPQTILQGLQFDLRKTQGFTAQLAKLRRSGLSPALLNQFASAGIDTAGGTVAALAGASRSQIGAINATQAKINASGATGGALVGSAVYDPTIRADVAAVHAMQHQTGVLDAAMRQIAPAIGRAVDAAMHGIVLRIDPQGVARLVRTGEKALSGRA